MSLDQGQHLESTQNSRHLLHTEITYSVAKEQDANILHELGYSNERIRYFTHLYRNRSLIESIVARHLGITAINACHLVDIEDWIDGSFNVCIRVDIDARAQFPKKQVMIRFPLPYRVGESTCPGNADEKIRCEAGTYIWLEENCPDVPIPHLYGFGLSTGLTFTHLENVSFVARAIESIRRQVCKWLGYRMPSLYIPHQIEDAKPLGTGYILIEYIDKSRGKMLSDTWENGRHDKALRTNLFRGLSRIMIALTRTPLQRIGSFTLDDRGHVCLTNRPLTLHIPFLENEGIPIDMSRRTTHLRSDSYINDLLAIHESRFRHQPNAVSSLQDGFYQACALMVMKSVWPCFFRRDLFKGPFFLHLTDLHQSNMFVDDNWNIKCLLDLEWACSRPVEMIHPPHWLTNDSIATIRRDAYEIVHKEFMEVLKEEENVAAKETPSTVQLHAVMQQGWDRGTFWCSLALNAPMSLFGIFYDHIQPYFSRSHKDEEAFWLVTMRYFTFDTFGFLDKKLKDREQYDKCLREAFTAQFDPACLSE